jgi:hypothetical protein
VTFPSGPTVFHYVIDRKLRPFAVV